MNNFQQEENTLLDNALNQLPLAPLPPGFTRQVMNAIGQNAPAVRFRLHFIDIALALFWAMVLAAVWLIVLWLTGILSPAWLSFESFSFKPGEQLALSNPSLLVGGSLLLLLEVSLLGLIGLNLLGDRLSPD